MKAHLAVGLAVLLSSAATAGSSYQDLDALDARIRASIPASGTAIPIDRRIKLAPCPDEPEISGPVAGAVAVRCLALGWKIRVAVMDASAAGTIAAPLLVHRGDAIEIVAQGPGYSVTSVGTALEEGPAGASIRVKIPTSPSPLAAVVARAGVASISY